LSGNSIYKGRTVIVQREVTEKLNKAIQQLGKIFILLRGRGIGFENNHSISDRKLLQDLFRHYGNRLVHIHILSC